MTKAIAILSILNIPFLLGGAGLIYWGSITEAKSLADTGSPKLIFYITDAAMIGIPLSLSPVSIRGAVKKRDRVKEIVTYGKPGTATILKLTDTNVLINGNPRVKLMLEISIPNFAAYQT